MPKLFALQGLARSGKSTSLVDLIVTLRQSYPRAAVQILKNGRADKAVILNGVRGMKVGIESQGDPGSRLQVSLAAFATAGCDIIFCACRTHGMTVDWVLAMAPPYSTQFVPKIAAATNATGANANTVQHLRRLAGV